MNGLENSRAQQQQAQQPLGSEISAVKVPQPPALMAITSELDRMEQMVDELSRRSGEVRREMHGSWSSAVKEDPEEKELIEVGFVAKTRNQLSRIFDNLNTIQEHVMKLHSETGSYE